MIVQEALLKCVSSDTTESSGKRKRHDSSESRHKIISTEQRIADALLKKCIRNAAKSANVLITTLQNMPPSQKRRDLIDDVTIMVILFDKKIL